MRVPFYIVNAFTNRLFSGNPAGVCVLDGWLKDDAMQKIAAESNFSETAFFFRDGNVFRLRWFAPKGEVDLCGHATLATAYVLFNELNYDEDAVRFETKSGRLNVRRDNGHFMMDFPIIPLEPEPMNEDLADGLGAEIVESYSGMDHIAVLESESAVRSLRPNLAMLARLDLRGVVVTARGTNCDYVCRCFAPKFGVNEDPVTGSAQCALGPYWAPLLGATTMKVKQLSKRGGDMLVEVSDNRVLIGGEARLYLKGEIET